jgi:hypothetical protein
MTPTEAAAKPMTPEEAKAITIPTSVFKTEWPQRAPDVSDDAMRSFLAKAELEVERRAGEGMGGDAFLADALTNLEQALRQRDEARAELRESEWVHKANEAFCRQHLNQRDRMREHLARIATLAADGAETVLTNPRGVQLLKDIAELAKETP